MNLKNKGYSGVTILIMVVMLSSCDWLKLKNEGQVIDEDPIARVGDQYLYKSDLKGLTGSDMSAADSANRVYQYINKWVRQQLIIAKAEDNMVMDEAELERRLLEYKYSLLIYEYKKKHINEQLDQEVSDEEIDKYYSEHSDNFKLMQNIIKGRFVKLSKDAPNVSQFRTKFRAKEINEEELQEYCYNNAQVYMLDDSTWQNFDELIIGTPIADIPNKIQFLKGNNFYETTDDNYRYFLRVKDYKITDEISPVDVVKDQIRTILINKRKVELSNKLEEDIYESAKENEEFELFGQ
ncbi:peptidyl-prolyl cis-trans isomerase [Marinigracilibium pacificum]|uniref:Peptidyl-prolyl cis-trans isomerase n=1 Tax=Marinigracilibium pacificum TaxID=2729599 RepID=A0A848IU36_9BACT|nr:peptidyl-prolyl cis-trans isomerase [Marinigracilibium pacificum]NMM46815.1 peptidyl-prolyl cis-trans isomerase [Marinigracilibium pacificum]